MVPRDVYADKAGGMPSRVHLPHEIEFRIEKYLAANGYDMLSLDQEEYEKNAYLFTTGGIRAVLTSLFGMEVCWDSDILRFRGVRKPNPEMEQRVRQQAQSAFAKLVCLDLSQPESTLEQARPSCPKLLAKEKS